ncbi:Phosphoethanolamine transferase eptA [Raoultella ornithinolytica]|nr:Phosphoethanolamine transferase eptA [Raoultella ornithinolytica]
MSLFTLRRPVMSRTVYLIIFALYVGLLLNLAFYRQVFTLLPVNSLHNWLVFLSMPVVAFSVMNILTTLASFLKLDRLVISLFILLSASAQYFIWTFGVVIDRAMITNILDTTPAESFALMSGKMVLTLGLSGVLMVALAWWIKISKAKTVWRSIAVRLLNILVSALLIVLVAALFYKDYASVFRNNKELVKSLSPSNSIVAINSWYAHNKMDNLPLVNIGEDAVQKPEMHSGPRKKPDHSGAGRDVARAEFLTGRLRTRDQPATQTRRCHLLCEYHLLRHGDRGVGTLHVLQHAAGALR